MYPKKCLFTFENRSTGAGGSGKMVRAMHRTSNIRTLIVSACSAIMLIACTWLGGIPLATAQPLGEGAAGLTHGTNSRSRLQV